jgi:hypothetical protein
MTKALDGSQRNPQALESSPFGKINLFQDIRNGALSLEGRRDEERVVEFCLCDVSQTDTTLRLGDVRAEVVVESKSQEVTIKIIV